MSSSRRIHDDVISQKASLIALILLLIHGGLLGWISSCNAPVYDEIAHVPSGLSHWTFGTFELYRVNPPLMRLIASVPLLVANPKTDWSSITYGPYSRPEFAVGRDFLRANGKNSFWYFTICRWAQIPVSMLGGWICYCWARELFGPAAALTATILWCFCPNTLAWGATITPDIGAATFGVAASYAFWRWLKMPSWTTALIAGVTLGLAELSKSTWIILFLIWPFVWLCWSRLQNSPISRRPSGRQLTTITLTGLCVLNLGYRFDGTFQRLGDLKFISNTLGGPSAHNSPGNRFRGTALGTIPVPVPRDYLSGIDVQKYDFERHNWSYLRGEHKIGGWWYYYLYALTVKTPLGTLLLLGLACLPGVVRCDAPPRPQDILFLLIPAIAILLLVSSQQGFNRYFRYVLPAIPFIYIYASRAATACTNGKWLPGVLCCFCIANLITESLAVFPHSMSFFNIAVGGPRSGPDHLLDANIDWGQDLSRLKHYVDSHPEVSPIRLAYFGFADPTLAGFPFNHLPSTACENGSSGLEPGWYAVSINRVRGYRHSKPESAHFTCFQCIAPTEMIGYSICIYHIAE